MLFFVTKNKKIKSEKVAVKMLEIKEFLEKVISLGASDVHLRVGEPPLIRQNGMIMKLSLPEITTSDLDSIFGEIAPEKHMSNFSDITDLDFVYELQDVARFRVNYSQQLGQPSFVFRIIPLTARTLEDLHFPELVQQILKAKSGLIFVTGPTGSGKSTTVAAILDWFNKNYQKHILTIESPVEYILKSDKSLISQRQVGIDTPTFADGMRYAIHQDPDVIFLGEISDRETAGMAIKAASMGYLVLSTMHTTDAVQTIINIVNMFDKNDRENIRYEIAENLNGTIAQKLVYSEKMKTRFAATEVVYATPTVLDCIRKDDIEGIYQLMNTNNPSIVSLNDSLLKLTLEDKISKEDALSYSNLPDELSRSFRREFYARKMEAEKAEEEKRRAEEEAKKLKEEEEKRKEEERKAEEKRRQEELKKIESEKKEQQNNASFEPQNDNFEPYSSTDFDFSSNKSNDGFEPMGY